MMAALIFRPASLRLELGVAAGLIIILTAAQLISSDSPGIATAALNSLALPAFLILCRYGIGCLITDGAGTSTD